MQQFLHVGCGPKCKDRTTKGFNTPDWHEIRLDIDPLAQPDVIGTMTDMSAVASESVDAVYSSHNIEHLDPHAMARETCASPTAAALPRWSMAVAHMSPL